MKINIFPTLTHLVYGHTFFDCIFFLLVILFILQMLLSFLCFAPQIHCLIPPLLPLWGRSLTHPPTPSSPSSQPPILWLQVSTRPRDSLPIDLDKAILGYICSGGHGSLHVYLVGGLVPESLGGCPARWYSFSYRVAITFSSFSTSPNYSIRIPLYSLMVGCEHPHLYWTGSGTAITGSCQQELFCINNSALWCLQMG